MINTTHYQQLPFLTVCHLNSGLHLDEVLIPALHLDQVHGVVSWSEDWLVTSFKTWILPAALIHRFTNEDRIARDRLAVSQGEQNYKENIYEHPSVAHEICSTSDVQIFMLTSFIFLGTIIYDFFTPLGN